MKAIYKSIDNYGWEIRTAEILYMDTVIFRVTFFRGNSHSVGHYTIRSAAGKEIGGIGGNVNPKSYANNLSKIMKDQGVELSKEDILKGLDDRKEENIKINDDSIRGEIMDIEQHREMLIKEKNAIVERMNNKIAGLRKKLLRP